MEIGGWIPFQRDGVIVLNGDYMSKGPVQQEMEKRLVAALSPDQLVVTNDSEKHRGHAGYDGTGESHFSVAVTSAKFSGLNRVARQRLVNQALGDLMVERIHALAIKAVAPGE